MNSDVLYYGVSAFLVISVLLGIHLLSKPTTAKLGNIISAISVILAVFVTFLYLDIFDDWLLYVFLAVGILIGIFVSYKIKMIEMPQLIAILNGIGGLASLIVGAFAVYLIGSDDSYFSIMSAMLALVIGTITFVGSLVAFLKLGGFINQKPVKIKGYTFVSIITTILMLALVVSAYFLPIDKAYIVILGIVLSTFFGIVFTISIGGADMPITISLLNSLSGLAAAISGLAISELLLVAYGGIVGASGLILTQIMCRAMNKSLLDVIMGRTTSQSSNQSTTDYNYDNSVKDGDPIKVFNEAKCIIIVPGYGMALAQAQTLVKSLADIVKERGDSVKFAIHPIAGRMPGHMNVLLAEVNVDYDDLYDLEDINDEFKTTDLVVIIGANDVINPAAKTAQGTPIYGMPILNVFESSNIFIFNYDLKPGYAGVENPLYHNQKQVHLFLGDAKVTLKEFIDKITDSIE